MVLDALCFDKIIEGADLVITGEGRLDSQTLAGKTPYAVLQRACKQGIPVIAVAGSVASDDEAICYLSGNQSDECGFRGIYQVTPSGMPLSDAMLPSIAAANIRRTVLSVLTDKK